MRSGPVPHRQRECLVRHDLAERHQKHQFHKLYYKDDSYSYWWKKQNRRQHITETQWNPLQAIRTQHNFKYLAPNRILDHADTKRWILCSVRLDVYKPFDKTCDLLSHILRGFIDHYRKTISRNGTDCGAPGPKNELQRITANDTYQL